jgi:Rod binding domain-containing protein
MSPAVAFEATLLAKMLNDLQETYSIEGNDQDSTKEFRGLATEALGEQFAKAGGIGLARLVANELPSGTPPKVLAKSVDIRKV